MSPDEIFSLDIEDYLYADGITAVEWAERAGDLIPPSALHILFESSMGREERRITLWTGNRPPGPAVPDE
jgi:tRNA A37 threonylcarbamoyladenosine biosynthesis protein TsaE